MKKILIFLVFFIFCKNGGAGSPDLKDFDNVWYKIEIKGTKVGYSIRGIKSSKTEISLYEKSMMDLNLLGKPETLFTKTNAFLDKDFNLKGFDFELTAGKYKTVVKGKVKNKTLDVEIKTGGQERKAELKFTKKLTTIYAIPFIISSLSPGNKVKFEIFDPMLFSVLPVEAKISKIKGDTVFTDVFIQNLHYSIVSLRDGTLLSQFEPPFVRTEISTEKEALASVPSSKKLDILKMFAIPCDKEISDARRCNYLLIEIKNMGEEPLNFEDNFQKLVSRDPFVLEMHSDIPDREAKVVDGEKFLKPTEYIQCEDPLMKKTASEICEGATTPVEKVDRIKSWVFNNLRKNPTASIPSALDVLKEKEGDCNEHSILFAALARAMGIPAKIVVGVVYLDGAFYYHAWNAVMLDGKWYSVDPTFNQFPADATHIKMEEGELKNQAKVLSIVGNIEIKIKDFKIRNE